MRHFRLAIALVLILTAGAVGSSFGADAAATAAPSGKVIVRTAAGIGEVREYKVDVSIKGNMPNPDTKESMKLDTSMALRLIHKYGRRDRDGLLPLEISLTKGDATISGEAMSISPNVYPKLTVLLDRTFGIDDIFGFGDVSSAALPGINYGNMAMLFHVPGLSQPRGVGDTWDSKIVIPSLKEAYSVKNTVKAISAPGAKLATLTLSQEIVRTSMPNSTTPPPVMRAAVESVFSQDNGKLLSSHVDCVLTPESPATKDPKSKQDTTAYQANIKMDVSFVK